MEHRQMLQAYSRPYKEVPRQLTDDDTGHRYGEFWPTYGEEPFPPYAKKLDKRGFPVVKKKKSKKDEDEEEEKSFLQLEPFDPDMADVDKIMKRYADKDADEELNHKEYSIPGDAEGGVSKIYAASLRHTAWEDDKYLKDLVEHYSTGGKGPDGTPDRTRVLGRFGAQEALRDAIDNWAGEVSMPALDRFIEVNFDQVWTTHDGYEADQVRLADGPVLLRELMSQ